MGFLCRGRRLWASGRRVRAVGNARALSTGWARCAVRRIVHLSIARRARSVRPPGPMNLCVSPCVPVRV